MAIYPGYGLISYGLGGLERFCDDLEILYNLIIQLLLCVRYIYLSTVNLIVFIIKWFITLFFIHSSPASLHTTFTLTSAAATSGRSLHRDLHSSH